MYSELYQLIHYKFNNSDLLTEALTHCSAAKESNFVKDYERLEFLGDSVLSLVMTTILMREFPDEPEGALAKRRSFLVNSESLFKIAINLGLNKYINMSLQESTHDSKQHAHILEDVVESIIGAMFLDGGLEPCMHFVDQQWKDFIHHTETPPVDPKTSLQEWSQERKLGIPKYDVITKSGSDHNPEFTVQVSLQSLPAFRAQASSKKLAEKEAANQMLNFIIARNESKK